MKEDIIAAKKAGVVSIAICRDCSYPDKNTMLRENPDFVISSLSELSKIIGSAWKSEILLSNPKIR
jgi:phosphoglycolate phosphatase-like HAD superfamily hydrolase